MSGLEAIAREVAGCQRCDLAKSRNLTVPGEGNPEADIMLIGEAPGWHENQQGRPFVGPAGKLAGGSAPVNRPPAIRGLHRKRGEVQASSE